MAALLLVLAASVFAQTFPKPSGYINDFAGVLSPEMKAQLEALATEVKEKTGAEVAVAIVKSLDGDTVEDYANNWPDSGASATRTIAARCSCLPFKSAACVSKSATGSSRSSPTAWPARCSTR